MAICYDGGVGKSAGGKLLKSGNFSSQADIDANCYNYATQSSSHMKHGWTCPEECYVGPTDFVDEVALNVDMGLYLDFQTDESKAGLQSGCPGMEGNLKKVNQGGYPATCPKGMQIHQFTSFMQMLV